LNFKPYTIGNYEQRGIVATSRLLFSPEAATELMHELQQALTDPESRSRAAWPGEICTFQVSPQFKGHDQAVSFHLMTGATPLTKRRVIWIHASGVFRTLMFLVGLIVSLKWMLLRLGLWAF
jgi:hypothetical protein